jgi:hypothetical protein
LLSSAPERFRAVYSKSDFSGVGMQSLFALNAGIIAEDSSLVTCALLSSVDLLAFWAIALNTIGFVKLGERVTRGQAVGVLIVIHLCSPGCEQVGPRYSVSSVALA